MNTEINSSPNNSPLAVFAGFSCPPTGYCELFSSEGVPRSHWRGIVEAFNTMGPELLEKRQRRARRMRHEDGATYNPFDDPADRTTPWSMDMVPLAITAEQWQHISQGIVQRAHLLNQVLADIYGAQDLIVNRHLPAELAYANPNFLRPCHGLEPIGKRFISLYAADLYRTEDGRFVVLRDYGSHPAGLGYALENRLVISRIFAELYQSTQTRRLAPFFMEMHRTILRRNELTEDEPGIVLLSPGPDHITYFEHALLSRYLGYPLVEGQDLSIRNGQVYLKKLAGLEPVEAIIRQIADHVSDPFTLAKRNADGVAGLVQAMRERSIDIINPVGSGFIDTPVLSAFLPGLCRLMRNEELLLADHPTWWCGVTGNRDHLPANMEDMQIQGAFKRTASLEKGVALDAAIEANPHDYIAREPVIPSNSPVWDGNRLISRPTCIRVFVCASEDGYAVMPGGLAITADSVEKLDSGIIEQQQTKDIWVFSETPVEPVTLLGGLQAEAKLNRSSDLPSRVADNLLWLGRYLERAEGQIRLLRAVYRRLSGEARPGDIADLPFLLSLLRAGKLLPSVAGDSSKIPQGEELRFYLHEAIYNREKADSLVAILWRVQQTARRVRDRLSLDCWRVICQIEDSLAGDPDDPLDFLDNTLYSLSSFSGLAMESMTRGLGWRFMDMGRRLERAMFQVGLVSSGLPLVCVNSRAALEALLEVGDSIMTYRARYRTTFQLAPVLDLLIVDESSPKSLAFQFQQLAKHVEHLPRKSDRRYDTAEERLALEMLTASRLLDLSNIRCGANIEQKQPLLRFLSSMDSLLAEFTGQITAHYLSRVPATPHFSSFFSKG